MGTSCGAIDIYDYGNGSILAAWPAFPGVIPDSFNVYVNGVLNQNVPPGGTWRADSLVPTADRAAPYSADQAPVNGTAVIVGLAPASYNASVVAPAGDGSHRPESLPPVGQITDAQTYRIKVAAVVGGIEIAASLERAVTVAPTSRVLVTPMPRGRFAFPNTPGGY